MNKPKVTWGMFRELTKDIPDDEEVIFESCDVYPVKVDLEETLANFTNDNTVVLYEEID